MKRFFVMLLFSLIFTSVFSEVNFDFSLSPGIVLKNYEIDKMPEDVIEWETFDYLPPFFEITYTASSGNNDLFYLSIPILPDASVYYLENNGLHNLPIREDFTPFVDSDIPYEVFYEISSEPFDFSIGRRKLKWGEGSYSLGINDRVPYMDHLLFSLNWDTSMGDFGYEYLLTAPGPKVSKREKTFVARKLSFEFSPAMFEIGEITLLYDITPNFVDLNPFLVYHNVYESNSNVAGYLSSTIDFKNYKLYSEFLLDQYQLPSESQSSAPNAYGFMVGGRKKGQKIDYGAEFYKTSTWLYNKGKDNEDNKDFTYPVWKNLLRADDKTINYFLGFPYGPDVELCKIFFESEHFGIDYEHLVQGSVNIDTPYTIEEWQEYSVHGPVPPTTVENIFRINFKIGNNPTFFAQTIFRNKELWMLVGFEYTFSSKIP
ncbi:hypothetical protein X927_06855 [Petrotoga mexicana DSM 14811]|uniref:Uncharacterized protein n=1 Tax=Petrotoga mexicana DSM 14811 TaxID=1122954 RepID=A0A2K1P7Y7_9BACT|nr:hypothetical protein [Petrotoga mexicana]PNR98893.1 hypothetical protein X927_06855 [Petrotoga mexicana DSM 14811]